jgi:hypothetical protein
MFFLFLKMYGNPLRTIHFIQNLLQQNLLKMKNINTEDSHLKEDVAYISDQLKYVFEIEDLLTVEVPQEKYNTNSPLIDKLSCLDLLIMKCASVLGEVFDI